MKTVNTVTGRLDVSKMGFTLSHEHFLITDNAMRFAFPDWVDTQEVLKQSVIEAKRMLAMGISTVIDATPINLGRDIRLLKEISKQSGLNIIAATGFYFQETPWFNAASFDEDYMADKLMHEVTEGIEKTDIRPGIIKCATDAPTPSAMNLKLLKMTARLQKRSGLPIMTHANPHHKNGLIQQELFAAEGVPLDNVIIGHCDDANDIGYILELLKNGSYIGMDRIGVFTINSTLNRINMIEKLIEQGYAERIVLSHDCNVLSEYGRMGASQVIRRGEDKQRNFGIITNEVLPELTRRGIPLDILACLTTHNIRRFVEGCN